MANCAFCGSDKMKPADFVDQISFRESQITRSCQKCQDAIFQPMPSDMDELDTCMDCGVEAKVRDLHGGRLCSPCQQRREAGWKLEQKEFEL